MKLEDFLFNKRYLSTAVLLLIFIIVLVVGGTQSRRATDSTETESLDTTEVTGELPESTDKELIALIEDYFEAYAGDDIESLETIAQPLTDNEKSYIGVLTDYYEEYQNITVYSTPGATEDSYMVSAVYDLKFYEIDTPAPGMEFFYVERDGKGNLIVNNLYSLYNTSVNREEEMDDEIYAMMCSYEQSEGVSALQAEVQSKYEEALKSDEDLATMIGNGTLRDIVTKWRDSLTETVQVAENDTETEKSTEETTEDKSKEETTETKSTESTESTETTESSEDSGKVKTKDICKVRKGPSTDSEVLGMVTAGVKLKKLGTEGDWTKVEFQGSTGYIKSSLLKAVKKKS